MHLPPKARLRIFLERQELGEHQFKIESLVDSSSVPEAGSGVRPYAHMAWSKEAQADSLNPSPVRVKVGRAQERLDDRALVPALKQHFKFGSAHRKYFVIFHHA
jgi:hypothetical protein